MTQDALAFPRGRAAWHAGFRALPYVERIRTTPHDVADWAAERYSTRRDLALLPAGGRASGHRCPGRTPGTLPACRGPLYDNVVSRHKVARLRHPQSTRDEIAIDKPLSSRFTLVVEQNTLFAALLPQLTASFSCVALMRNPLAVPTSWQTVNLLINQGRLTGQDLPP